jgi:hypothetical protein
VVTHIEGETLFVSRVLRRIFVGRVLRRIFGPKRDEVAGAWRKPYNEELSDMCSSSNIILVKKLRRIGMARH